MEGQFSLLNTVNDSSTGLFPIHLILSFFWVITTTVSKNWKLRLPPNGWEIFTPFNQQGGKRSLRCLGWLVPIIKVKQSCYKYIGVKYARYPQKCFLELLFSEIKINVGYVKLIEERSKGHKLLKNERLRCWLKRKQMLS